MRTKYLIILLVLITEFFVCVRAYSKDTFRLVNWGQPNTNIHFKEALNNFTATEVDLMINSKQIMIAAHDPIQLNHYEKNNRDMITLEELFQLPYKEFYLDLKDTKVNKGKNGLIAIEKTTNLIKKYGLEDKTYLMIYTLSHEISNLQKDGIRFMFKGHHRRQEVAQLSADAAEKGFVGACFPISSITENIIKKSNDLDFFHVPWVPWTTSINKRHRKLIEAGLRGIIIPKDKYLNVDII